MSDESVLGLLLRSHAELSAQCHGELYLFKNVSAASHYENAYKSVESAIRSLGLAEQYVVRAEKDRTQKGPA